jgi:tetratricopeptide (TPR) repeat protein
MKRNFLFILMLVTMGLFGCSSGLDSKGQTFVKGRELFLNKDYDSAIEQFTKVIEMDEKFVEAYNMRGSCYSALKKNDEAVKDFSKAIELNPDNRGAYLNRSLAFKAMGKLPQAKSDTLKANKIND